MMKIRCIREEREFNRLLINYLTGIKKKGEVNKKDTNKEEIIVDYRNETVTKILDDTEVEDSIDEYIKNENFDNYKSNISRISVFKLFKFFQCYGVPTSKFMPRINQFMRDARKKSEVRRGRPFLKK